MGNDPSADSVAKTEAGCRRCPVLFFLRPKLRDWHKAINPFKEWSPSLVLVAFGQLCFRAPTAWTAFEYMAVMEEAIEHSADGGAVAEQLPQSSTGRFEVSKVLARS